MDGKKPVLKVKIPFYEAVNDLFFRWTDLNGKNAILLLQKERSVIVSRSSPNSHKKLPVFTPWICNWYQLLHCTVKDQAEALRLLTPKKTRENQHFCKFYLFCKKGRLVSSISRFVSSAPHGFHVGNSHAKDGQLVGLASQGAARGHHVRQLRDVLGHLIPPAPLNLTVILPEHLKKHQSNRRGM